MTQTNEGAEVCALAPQKGQRPLGEAETLARACDALRSRIDMSSLPVAEIAMFQLVLVRAC